MDILTRLTQLEHDAEQFGFKWERADQIMEQIRSECTEIEAHLPATSKGASNKLLQEEIGDLLHAAFSLCVFNKFDPHTTLTNSIEKFQRRLEAVKKLALEQGVVTLEGRTFEELMHYWRLAKQAVG